MNSNQASILISEDFPIWSQTQLQMELPSFEIIKANNSEIINGLFIEKNIVGLLVRSTTRVDAKLLKNLPHLKIVGTATSGFDHFDLKLINEKNIIAFHTPDANAESTADLTFWHVLSCLRNLNTIGFTNINWRKDLKRGSSAPGLSLGVVGMGRIGKKVARRALGFGLKVFYHDPYIDFEDLKPSLGDEYLNLESLGLMELFTHCDIVSLHVPLTPKTRGFINSRTFEHFGLNKILINCARGELIRNADLIEALDSDILMAAGLDTFEQEPLDPSSVIRSHPKITWTPHIGAYTTQAFESSCQEAVVELCSFLKHQKMPTATLPPKTLWAQDLLNL